MKQKKSRTVAIKIRIKDMNNSSPDELIHDTMDVKKIEFLSPFNNGFRRSEKSPQGIIKFIYKEKQNSGNIKKKSFVRKLFSKFEDKNQDDKSEKISGGTNQSLPSPICKIYGDDSKIPTVKIIKREISISRDDWSRTDNVEDTYIIENYELFSVSEVKIKTEFFRDELNIFDSSGRSLPFESCRVQKISYGPNPGPYFFVLSLYSPLGPGKQTTLTLKYKVISDNPLQSVDYINGIRDSIPFLVNEGYFYRFFDIEHILNPDNLGFTFTMKTSEGTTVTSYAILHVDGKSDNSLGLKAYDMPPKDETNFYSEGSEVFFALSGKNLKGVKYILVFLRISPQKRAFLAVSSIQILTVLLLGSVAISIHALPFTSSFTLITGMFFALLTLLLYPERSRLMDTRISVSAYSLILLVAIALHFTSYYLKYRLVSDLLIKFPSLKQLLIPAAEAVILVYVIYVILDWVYRRGKLLIHGT